MLAHRPGAFLVKALALAAALVVSSACKSDTPDDGEDPDSGVGYPDSSTADTLAHDASTGDGGPCAAPLPAPVAGSDLVVDVYAVFDTRPGGLSFDAAGNLYVGNFGKDAQDDPSAVLRVSPAGTITKSSALIADPDVLIVDLGGKVGAPGSVLVGGVNAAKAGQLTEMSPDGSSASALLTGGCLGNINHLVFHPDGRLLVTNYDEANVCAVAGGQVTELIAAGSPLATKAATTVPSPDGTILFVTSENVVHKYDAAGQLIQAKLIDPGAALAYGPVNSAFAGLLVRKQGALYKIDPGVNPPAETKLLTGPIGGNATFDAHGYLYLSDTNNFRVLRIAPSGTPRLTVCP